jgi:hypothetical protein
MPRRRTLHRLILLAEPTAACHPTFKSLGQKCPLSQFISAGCQNDRYRSQFIDGRHGARCSSRPADGDHSQSPDGMVLTLPAAICLSAGLYVLFPNLF